MTTFLLIRHGETDALGKSMMGRRPGWHLNASGRQQAEKLGETLSKFPIRAIYTSPLERAIETAEPFARQHQLASQPLEELNELDMGDWEGRTMAELALRDDWQRFNTYRSGVRCPGGELMIEAQTRMVSVLDSLRGRHPEDIVAVVSHGDPLRAALAYFLGIPLDLLLRFEISPASFSVVEASDYAPRVMCLNVTGEGL